MKSDITLVSRSRPDFGELASTATLCCAWPGQAQNPIRSLTEDFPKDEKGHHAHERDPLGQYTRAIRVRQMNSKVRLALSTKAVNRKQEASISRLKIVHAFLQRLLYLFTEVRFRWTAYRRHPARRGVPGQIRSDRCGCRSYRPLITLQSPAAGLPGCCQSAPC